MASIIKRKEKLGDSVCIFGGSRNKISSKGYRIYHHKLTGSHDYYSNGYIDLETEETATFDSRTPTCWEAGIDKRYWKVHDVEGFNNCSN